MADLLHTVWGPSLKDATSTFNQKLRFLHNQLQSSVRASNVKLVKNTLRNILTLLFQKYQNKKIPGYIPFVTYLLFEESKNTWESIFINIEKNLFADVSILNTSSIDNEIFILCIEIILGFLLLRPHLYQTTNPHRLLKSMSNKILKESNIFDLEELRIKELINAFKYAAQVAKQNNVDRHSFTLEEAKFEKHLRAININTDVHNRAILELLQQQTQ